LYLFWWVGVGGWSSPLTVDGALAETPVEEVSGIGQQGLWIGSALRVAVQPAGFGSMRRLMCVMVGLKCGAGAGSRNRCRILPGPSGFPFNKKVVIIYFISIELFDISWPWMLQPHNISLIS
jgi:hypothetical protein